MAEPAAPATRCGFVALIGAPNAGKSTLLNALVGTKISIVTPKVQTTRALIRGIAIDGSAQLIFVDTPGIFAPRRRLDRAMVASAWSGAQDADAVVHLVDAPAEIAVLEGEATGADKRSAEDVERIVDGLKAAEKEPAHVEPPVPAAGRAKRAASPKAKRAPRKPKASEHAARPTRTERPWD